MGSYSEYRKKKKEGVSSTPSKKSSGTYGEYVARKRVGLDTFESDLAELGTTVESIYSGWQPPETINNTKSSIEAMQKRVNALQTYQNEYTSLGIDADTLANTYQKVLEDIPNLSSAYSHYQNADAYSNAQKKAQMAKDFSGLSYDDVQAKLKEYDEDSEEYKFLSEYGVNVGYSDLRDYDKELENIGMSRDAAKDAQNTIAGSPLSKSFDVSSVTANEYGERLAENARKYALDHAFDSYKDIQNAEGFEESSKYKEAEYDGLMDRLFNEGKDAYEYVNFVHSQPSELVGMPSDKYGWNAGIGKMPAGIENMTKEEVAVFNAIADEKGYDEAFKFLKDMEVTLSKRGADKNSASTAEWLEDGNAVTRKLKQGAMTVLSVPAGLVGGVEGALDDVSNVFSGDEINPYNSSHSMMNFANTVQSTTSENIGEYTEENEWVGTDLPLVGNAWSFGYDTGLSIAESAIGISTFGSGFTPIMGMGAASNKAKELKEAGATENEVVIGATASGVAEAFFEKYSIEGLLGSETPDTIRKAAKNFVKQSLTEASEEMVTEFSNAIVDLVNRQNTSDIMKSYNDYLERGYSEEEAFNQVHRDVAEDIIVAGIGGAISGGVLGGTYNSVNYHNLDSQGKQIRANERAQDMMALSEMTPKESETYKLYNEYAQRGVNADNIKNAQLGNLYTTATSEGVKTAIATTPKTAEEKTREQRAMSLHTGEETKVADTGNSVKIEGIKMDGDETILLTSDGEVTANNIALSKNDAELVSFAESMGEEKGSLLLSQYDGTASVKAYVNSFEMAYSYGETGFGADSVLKNRGVLTETQAAEIYKAGMMNKVNVQQKAIAEINAKHSKEMTVKGVLDDSVIDYDNATTDGNKVAWKSLTPTQREAITFAKGFAEATGVNIKFVKSDIVNGKHVGKNGSYNPETNTIEIDVYAGRIDVNSTTDAIIPTISHEVTHWMKAKSPAMYNQMREYVMNTLSNGKYTAEQLVDAEMDRIKKNHPDAEVSEEMAIDELIARACEDMLSNSNAARKMLNQLSTKDKSSFVEKVKKTFKNLMDWVNELLSKYKSGSNEAKFLREYQGKLKELSKMWDEALVEAVQTNQSLQKEGITGEQAINAVMEKVGITVDLETESASPATQFSERTWTESEYVQNREKAVAQLSKTLGVSKKKTEKYIDNINSIARLIADDRARLDYEPNLDEHATVVKPNSEYKYSVDMSTLCAKRLLFTGTFDAIQRLLPNTAMDSDDIVKIRAMMKDAGHEVACGICYVESTRREIGTITADFIERYKEAQRTGKPISRINSAGKEVALKEKGTGANFYVEEGYTPNLAELNTTDIDLVKRDHPSVYAAYLAYMNARGQAKPKLLETRAEYKGEILKHFKAKSAVQSRNAAGGLRLQSFSDFEIPHLIDMMQIITDMSSVGLMSQAYTKVPNFAEAFGDTGVKINLSLIAKDSGLDADGNLIFDDVEGINHEDAFRLRDKYSKNVGTILVGKNDAHIIAAMADPRIDYIIPFHKSSWKESLYDALGLTGYDDYTETQNEKPIDKSRKISNFAPSEYWDYSKPGEENAQIYLQKCREDGRIPKFPQFQSYEGYWKLLIDFKMYDNDGVGSPQMPVTPNFNMTEANRMLEEYKGGHRSYPVAKDVVDKFVKEYKKDHPQEQYADREITTLEAKDYDALKNFFGTTTNFKVAGYMLKDGKMLDFSGKHWGNPSSDSRDVDHRDVWDVWENADRDGTDEMVNMIGNGNIRLMPEIGGINLAVAPTAEQRKMLAQYIRSFKGDVVVDIDRVGGDTIESFTYDRGASAESVLNDIDNYFRGGRQSDLMRFHSQYSDRDTNASSIKEQLAQSADDLNKMNSIATVDGNISFSSRQEFVEWLLEQFKKYDYKVSREGFGEIILDKKRISNGLRYIKTAEEKLAFSVVPEVLQKGIVIGEHKGHKGRDYDTVTFASPITINGVRYNMGVVVRIENNNYYKVHRVVLPRISEDADNKNRDTAERAGGVNNNSSLSPTDNTSMNSIAPGEGFSQYSDRDSDGKQLTEEQMKFFEDSKVRDNDGKLLVMYHGSPFKFTTFENREPINGRVSGDGFYFTESKKEASYWGKNGKNYKVYLNITNPFVVSSAETTPEPVLEVLKKRSGELYDKLSADSKWWGNKHTREEFVEKEAERFADTDKAFSWIEDKTEVLKSLGYDGVIVMNESKSLARKDMKYTEVVAFYPNQIKQTTNKKPTADADIRYSDRDNVSVYEAVGEDGRLASENAKLREDIARLKSAISSDEVSIRRFRSLADYLKKLAGSQYNRETLGDELKEIYTFIQTADNLQWHDVMAQTYDIASRMMSIKEGVTPNYFKSVLADIRIDRVSLSAEQKGEAVKLFGNYSDFHKSMFGRINIVNEGTPLSEMWKTWSQKYPSIFDANLSETEQIKALVDTVDALKTTSSVMGEYEREEAIRHIATEVYNQFWNIASDTSEDVKKLRTSHRSLMEELRKAYAERQKQNTLHPTGEVALKYEQLLRKVKEKDAKEMARIKELSKARMDNYKDRIAKNNKIQSITKKALTLNQWLVKNSKDAHIPEVMKPSVVQLLNAIDFSSKQLLGLHGGERRYTETKKDISLKKALEQVHKMADNIAKQSAEAEKEESVMMQIDMPQFLVDELSELSEQANDIAERVGDNAQVLNMMSLEELESLNNVISTLKKIIQTANESFAINQKMKIDAMGNQWINHNTSLRDKKMNNLISDFLEYDNATPYYVFKRMGAIGMDMFNAFMDAQEQLAILEDEIEQFAAKTFTPQEAKEWSQKVLEFEVLDRKKSAEDDPKYKTIQMTVAQAMSVYALSKRESGLEHLLGGGIRIKDIELNGKLNKIVDAHGSSLSRSELEHIIASLNDRQKAVVNELQNFMSTRCAELGNEVTLKRWGIKQFVEEFYFPMQTIAKDKNFDNMDKNENSIYRLLNLDFTKKLTPNANNQLIIDNIFDVFASHTTDMAKYNTFALPMLDSIKLLSYSYKQFTGDEEDSRQHDTVSVVASIKGAFGDGGVRYITNLLKDMNGAEVSPRGETIPKKLMSNYKVSAVGANLRVVLLQGTAFVKAGLNLESRYLLKALMTNGVKGSNKALEYSGIALWKSKGHYDLNIARSVASRIKQDMTVSEKLKEASLDWAGKADKLTWGYLWNACELWAKDNTTFAKGSEDFNQAVSKRFRELIVSTQVVDSVLTRTQMMRSKSAMVQTLTAFMSESAMTYNMLADAFFEWSVDARQEGKSYKSTVSKHGRTFARTASVFVFTNTLTSLIGALVDAIRDDDEEKEFDEKYLEHFLENFKDSMNVFSTLPILKDLKSISDGYSPTRFDEQSFVTLASAYRKWIKVFEGEGNVYQAAYKTLQGLSQLGGVPIANAVRDAVAMWNLTVGEVYPSLKIK